MRPLVEDQYTAARAYFLCVVGMLFCEGLIQLPGYVTRLRYRGRPRVKASTSHSRLRAGFHKLATFPSVAPFLTRHNAPDYLRFAIFAGLNVLWGWNRIRYTTDYKLYGWLTIANAGFGLLAASRTNLFSHVLGIPSSVLLLYHQFAGRAAIVHATLHFTLTADHYIKSDQLLDVLASSITQAGLVAWCALCIIAITSLPFVRRRCYEAFYYPHAFFLVFVIGALIHATKGPEFLLPGLLLWVCDRVIRLVRSLRGVSVKSVIQHHGDVIKIKVHGVRPSHPGQVAWIQIPGVSFLNWHPFTIASAPGDETATFAIRGLGGFTRKAQGLATDAGAATPSSGGVTGAIKNADIKMRFDGPFGLGSLQWEQYPVVVLVAGGIGITPGISIATHIMHRAVAAKDARGPTSHSQWHVHLLWIIKDARHTTWFEEELNRLSSMAASSAGHASLNVTIHVSGRNESPTGSPDQDEESYAMGEPWEYVGPGAIVQGRPNLLDWFRNVRAARPGLDAAVNLCGPRRLIDDARKAAARASGVDGLFHVEEEVFEF